LKSKTSNKSILLTFDVEEWFQVENFKGYIPFSSWSSFDLRVESNTHIILDLLDSFSFKPKATFFILGWIAKRVPDLVREIHDRGHEVASHGTSHHLCTQLLSAELLEDLWASKKHLEDLTGAQVYGYRAPSFALDNDILKLIHKAGYLYDSSYNSFAMHGRYGSLDLSQAEKQGSAFKLFDDFFELPVSNLSIGTRIFPLGGGGYFRLIPFQLFKQGMKSVLSKDGAFIFYSHPWEFDPDQPRVKQASKGFKFRHYTNLKRTRKKLYSLIDTFSQCEFSTCRNYIG
jgi:polysaccharide deacetylase family protein (PEP-CTERM system associated)